ncbi:MAG: cyclic nucleotide-binding domain-containing protein [Alphaproteobacteria bacterium]|nr:cyclic nucleotide-binding domain-containing protein [Alphaproteobacteria bacterium]
MSINEEVDALRRIPLFSNLEPSKLKLLAFTSERLTYAKGQAIFRQGDMGDAAYIVLEGQADVVIGTADNQRKVATIGKHSIIGEIAVLCDVPRTATVVAVDKLVALKISKDLFLRMVKEFPQMAVEIMRELARRLDRTNQQLAALSKQS